MKNQHSEGGENLLKALLRKRTNNKVSRNDDTTRTDQSKKICISTQNLQNEEDEKLFKVKTIEKEKVNINESESKSYKPKKEYKKMCFCSPTTHEGSFRCHLHRLSEKKSNLNCNSKQTHCAVGFKPQLSRFGRAASAEVITHGGLSKPPEVSSTQELSGSRSYIL